VHEVPVLQRSSEERPWGRDPLELGAVVAEADDDGAAPAFTESFEQDVDALVVEQLAEVENGRLVALEPGREALGVALVGKPLLRVAGVRRIAARLVEQVLERRGALLGLELLDVDAGRHLVDAVDVAHDLSSTERMCASRRRSPLPARATLSPRRPAPRCRASSTRARAVRLDRVRRARRGRDRPPSKTWLAKTRSAGSSARTAAAFAST
jgi:hypothetical protein